MPSHIKLLPIVFAIVFTASNAYPNYGNPLQQQTDSLLTQLQATQMDAILYWDLVAVQAGANDYNPLVTSSPQQGGPTRTSRVFAIIHGAMYDAFATFHDDYQTIYRPNNMPNVKKTDKKSATNAAIMEAAYQTLIALYSEQQPIFDAVRTQYLKQIRSNGNKQSAINLGILVGKIVAQFILTSRQNDGSQVNMTYTPINLPGYHQPDPLHLTQGFLTPQWGQVEPFFLEYGSQFRPSDVVGNNSANRLAYLNSPQYISDFIEVQAFGAQVSSVRTPDQTQIGVFWSYDGTTNVGVPPRIYNQVVRTVAIQQNNTLEQNALLFALINYGMGDASIAAWDCKYFYQLWRPIDGIRAGYTYIQADPTWVPYGATDGDFINYTPSFPTYVSGHSVFGSTIFEILRQFYGTDDIAFQLQSDEFNGKTIDAYTGQPRPVVTRSYQSFTQAELENYFSRIYLGVHWPTDQANGKILGRNVGEFVFGKFNQVSSK